MKKNQTKPLTPDQKKLAAAYRRINKLKRQNLDNLGWKIGTLKMYYEALAEISGLKREVEAARNIKKELQEVKNENAKIMKTIQRYVSSSVEIVNLSRSYNSKGRNFADSVHKIRPNILDSCGGFGEKKY